MLVGLGRSADEFAMKFADRHRGVFKVLNGKNRIGRHMENGDCRIAVHRCVSFIRVRQAFQWADNAWRTRMGFTHGSNKTREGVSAILIPSLASLSFSHEIA